MLEIPVYNTDGKRIDALKVDRERFGGAVNAVLLKQAIVIYHGNKRRGTAATRSRGMVAGSTRKLFRQKGTGSARRGNVRTNILRGGGVAFAKGNQNFRRKLPRKMRRAALNSAILAKIIGNDLMVIDGLKIDQPKTSDLSQVLRNLKINRSCLLALGRRDRNVYLSSRNIPGLTVCVAGELNALDVATRQKMLVTTEAMAALVSQEKKA